MKRFLFVAFSFYIFLPSPALAAAFYLQEQSVSGQGAAFAGAAAHPRDATILFYNPAGMTALEKASASAQESLIAPQAHFANQGSTAGLTAGAQGAYAGVNGENPYSPAILPALYAAVPVDHEKRYWVGLSVTAPFGLSNQYDHGWFGRYDSTSSKLQDIDISPVFAAKLNDQLSVGGGIDIQRVNVTLKSALPCPSVAFGCGPVFSTASDGASALVGDSWAAGFNAGVLWQPQPATRIGASYRSAITHNVKGNATVSGLSGALAAQNSIRTASAKLNLPDIAGLSVAHDMSDRLTLLGSYNWFGWNKFKEIRVNFDNGAPANVTREDYKNSYSFALGAEWKQTDALTMRTGVQYDKTPVTDAERNTRVPDASRYWLSFGAGYKISNNLSVDAAASHIFMTDSHINLSNVIYGGTAASTANVLHGSSANALNIISLQISGKF